MSAASGWQHFLTLPNGHVLDVPEGDDANDVFARHVRLSLSEGLCPWCASRLDDRLQCIADPRHVAVRWHRCDAAIGYVLLAVPATSDMDWCDDCQQRM